MVAAALQRWARPHLHILHALQIPHEHLVTVTATVTCAFSTSLVHTGKHTHLVGRKGIHCDFPRGCAQPVLAHMSKVRRLDQLLIQLVKEAGGELQQGYCQADSFPQDD